MCSSGDRSEVTVTYRMGGGGELWSIFLLLTFMIMQLVILFPEWEQQKTYEFGREKETVSLKKILKGNGNADQIVTHVDGTQGEKSAQDRENLQVEHYVMRRREWQ